MSFNLTLIRKHLQHNVQHSALHKFLYRKLIISNNPLPTTKWLIVIFCGRCYVVGQRSTTTGEGVLP